MIEESKFDYPKEHKNYMPPQVLTNVDHGMKFMMEETFGPCVGIMPVENDKEGINLMNDSPYGLTASIWTKDIEAAKKTLPKNVFSYLHLIHEDSLKMVSDKRTAFVSFTGSVKAG